MFYFVILRSMSFNSLHLCRLLHCCKPLSMYAARLRRANLHLTRPRAGSRKRSASMEPCPFPLSFPSLLSLLSLFLSPFLSFFSSPVSAGVSSSASSWEFGERCKLPSGFEWCPTDKQFLHGSFWVENRASRHCAVI